MTISTHPVVTNLRAALRVDAVASGGLGLLTAAGAVLLGPLLGLPVPRWHHHPLLLDETGGKLAKRRGSGAGAFGLAERRASGEDGAALADVLRQARFPVGITLASA